MLTPAAIAEDLARIRADLRDPTLTPATREALERAAGMLVALLVGFGANLGELGSFASDS